MVADKFIAPFQKLNDKSGAEQWRTLASIIGDLIKDDRSLRGDLAHLFLHFQSESSVHRMSINATVEAIQDFQLFLHEVSGEATVEIKNPQTIRKFILRETNEIIDARAYLNLVLFMVGASVYGGARFFSHFTFQEIGGLKTLISRIYAIMVSSSPNLTEVVHAVQEFGKLRPILKTVRHDLGGMLELGNQDTSILWSIIFRKTKGEILSYLSGPSLERHYICYRFSSFGGSDRIVKSFLVLQSPGTVREHFAFKVYYKSGSQQIRKSAGAIVSLGDVVTCFGSSRVLMDGDRFGGLDGDTVQILGPKTIALDSAALNADDVLVPAQLMTINEYNEVISCRMLCVRTNIQHSDIARIGSFPLETLIDELGEFTDFGSGKKLALSDKDRESVWNFVIEKLKNTDNARVSKCLSKRDFDIRALGL